MRQTLHIVDPSISIYSFEGKKHSRYTRGFRSDASHADAGPGSRVSSALWPASTVPCAAAVPTEWQSRAIPAALRVTKHTLTTAAPGKSACPVPSAAPASQPPAAACAHHTSATAAAYPVAPSPGPAGASTSLPSGRSVAKVCAASVEGSHRGVCKRARLSQTAHALLLFLLLVHAGGTRHRAPARLL